MIKTLTLDGLTSVTIKQSAYDMARFCWVNNRSGSDIFMSCTDPQCTENSDGVKRIPVGEYGMLDTESYEVLYIKGSGMVNIETSPFAVPPFGEGKKGGGISLSGESSYTISNAVDYPLLGLSLYGKSVQDGTPTPDNPVEIVSVGDSGSVVVQACGKNLFPWNDYTKIPYSVAGQATVLVTADKIKYQNIVGDVGGFFVAAPAISPILSKYNRQMITFSAEVKSDNSASIAFGTYRTFSRYSVQNEWEKISHTLYYDIDDTFIINCEGTETTVYIRNIQIEIGDTATAYEPYHGATANITTALPLCGIPVDSGGNHTDKNGQQWICDELLYNADGTGKIVKHTVNTIITSDGATLSSNNNVIANSSYNRPYDTSESGVRRFKLALSGLDLSFIVDNDNSVLCSVYEFNKGMNNTWFRTAQFGADMEAIWFCDPDNFNTLDEFFNFIKNNPMELVYPLAEPQEIPLTAAEMAELRQLMTYSGTTDISNSDNADMDVKYCTNKTLSECVIPITTALQAQIDELKSAVLSLGGNV